MIRTIALVLIGIALMSTRASAEPLPAGATPLSEDEIVSLYTGKSAEWGRSAAYFAPDRTVIGVFGKPNPHFSYNGKWKVSGNEICMETKADAAPGKVFLDCWSHSRHGNQIFTLKSHTFDSGKNNDPNTYYTHEIPKLVTGDTISQRYRTAGGK